MTDQPTERSPNTIGLFGHDVDINDDAQLKLLLGDNATQMLTGIPPQVIRTLFHEKFVEFRLVTVKFGFIIQKALEAHAMGVGMETMIAFYEQMIGLCELEAGAPRSHEEDKSELSRAEDNIGSQGPPVTADEL
jgi:hypothetical protein